MLRLRIARCAVAILRTTFKTNACFLAKTNERLPRMLDIACKQRRGLAFPDVRLSTPGRLSRGATRALLAAETLYVDYSI